MVIDKTGLIRHRLAHGGAILGVLLLAACSTTPPPNVAKPAPTQSSVPQVAGAPVMPAANSGRGGYYQDDGPGDNPPPNLLQTPDAEPRIEPIGKATSRTYTVLGRTYTPIADQRPFRQRGIATWYGKKFHGQRTASGERYDMYKMTAAHPTLPIPSYARITSIGSGKSVIVRINDRGPFHANRITDLSYTAALKLGLLGRGSQEVEVERLLPDEIARIRSQQKNGAAPVVVEVGSVSLPPPAPAPVAAPVAAPIAAPIATSVADAIRSEQENQARPGVYLQFGAYSQAGNAESMRQKLAANWQSSLPPLQVVQTGNLFRLYGGPFDSRADALLIAERMQNDGLGNALVVLR